VSIERERELKLDVGDHVELGDLGGLVPSATMLDRSRFVLKAVYYDTEDLRLARWGCSVRHRDDSGWMVKLPVWATGPALVRDEVSVDPDGLEPPLAATRLVSSLTRGAPLFAVASLISDRSSVRFAAADGSLVAELLDDRVTVEVPAEPSRQFRQIEIELGEGVDDTAIDPLVAHLESVGCRPGLDALKLVRGLGPRALGPPDVVVPEVSEWATGREVIHAAIAKSVAALVHYLPVARLGEEPEGVHQARVSTRRLRSDLRTFGPLLDPVWRERVEPDLRSFARALGTVRDDDVLLSALGEIDVAARMMPRFEAERHDHHAALLRVLDDPRTAELLDELIAAAHDPPTAPHADDPAPELLRPIIRKRWRKLRRAVEALGTDPSADDLHGVRILGKRCRYALEAVTPAFGPAAKSRAKAIARLQDVLGELHDATVISRRLEETDWFDTQQAFAAGQTAEHLMIHARAELPAWVETWSRVVDEDSWRWL
jgi:CHAD domain-containing protein